MGDGVKVDVSVHAVNGSGESDQAVCTGAMVLSSLPHGEDGVDGEVIEVALPEGTDVTEVLFVHNV